ncbi:MAG: GBS Bsp-like repeat-containing protein [Clostridiales Family XIII bacterium]|jgi:uncharacterized repeat protein (TIGR02543 family)|nr:GBS Bsp-like repeat-containing protein [Clostridiales Family XIII bacterium]
MMRFKITNKAGFKRALSVWLCALLVLVFAVSPLVAVADEETTGEAITDAETDDDTTGAAITGADTAAFEDLVASAPALTEEQIDELTSNGAIKENQVLVVMRQDVPEEAVVAPEDEATETVDLSDELKIVKVETDADVATAIEEYQSDPNVAFVQPNFTYTLMDDAEVDAEEEVSPLANPNDPNLSSQWALLPAGSSVTTRVNEAWTYVEGLGLSGAKVKVAVIDTGVQTDHPDLAANLNTAKGWNYVTNGALLPGSTVKDIYGHGTHVAGIIGAVTDNGTGVAGVAHNHAEIIPYQIFWYETPSSAQPTSETIYVYQAYNKAVSEGCRIINLSLGSYDALETYDILLQLAIDSAYANGVITVAAAGNGTRSTASFPSDFPNVVSVVATNNDNTRWYASDYNANKNISAPGNSIYSTYGHEAHGTVSAAYNSYAGMQGTSMATGYVSGVLALILYVNPNLTAAQAVDILYSTATDLGTPGKDIYFGYGLVNAEAAVQKARNPQVTVTFNANGGTTLSMASKTAYYGAAYGTLATTSRTGYTFDGWYTAASGGTKVTSTTKYTAVGNSTLYAHWKANNYTVTFNSNGGITPHSTVTQTYGQPYVLPADPVRTGYTFTGWYTAASGGTKVTSATTYTLTTGSTLYAHWDTGNVVTSTLSADQQTISMSASGLSYTNVTGVSFAVWGAAAASGNTQNDLRWVPATNSGGTWTASEAVSYHKETGLYYIHVYATLSNGTSVYVGASSVNVNGLTAAVSSPSKNVTSGYFTLQAGSFSPATAVSEAAGDVRVAVWTEAGGQDDLRWYNLSKSGSNFAATIYMSSHGYQYGNYICHFYAKQKNGIDQFVGSSVVSMTAPASTVTASLTGDQQTIIMAASGVTLLPGVSGVRFAVWGDAGGQNDLRWYNASSTGVLGGYATNVPVSNHKETGTYYIHTYATLTNGTSIFIGGQTVNVLSLTGTATGTGNPTSGNIEVTITGLSPESALSSMKVAVWTNANQSDLKWITLTKTGSGTYKATDNMSAHGYQYGQYYAHIYATQKNGIEKFLGAANFNISPGTALTAALSPDQSQITLGVTGVNLIRPVSKVQFAVWGAAGTGTGQNDLVWYTANDASGGTYSTIADIVNHREAGVYNIHAYATMNNGTAVFLGSVSVTVGAPSGSIGTVSRNLTAGTFTANVTANGSSASGVAYVQVAVWSKADQSDIHWYDAPLVSGNTYKLDGFLGYHGYSEGTYYAHVYATLQNGVQAYIGSTTFSVTLPASPAVQAVFDESLGRITAATASLRSTPGVVKVQFAVWGLAGGQNDLIWYNATNVGGVWRINAPVLNHKEGGSYAVHVYATYTNGATVYLGSASVTNVTYYMRGIDVSYWQGDINWAAVKASGVDFAIIRIGYFTEGSSNVFNPDLRFIQNVQGAKAVGLKIGTYIYNYNYTNTSMAVGFMEMNASAQMNAVRAVGGFDLPVFLDMEDADVLNGAAAIAGNSGTARYNYLTNFLKSSMDAMRGYGWDPGVYANLSWAQNYYNQQQLIDQGYKFWLARWYTNSAEMDPFTAGVWPGGQVNAWQYRSTGSVAGIGGNVDMDYYYG